MITIYNQQIERALIVDDDPEVRNAFEYVVHDMDVVPYQVVDELRESTEHFLSTTQSRDMILCDFQLKTRNYAPCNGDQVLADCFRANVPGVLCTSVAEPLIRRDCLRYIPGVVRTRDPQPADLRRALERCLREMEGEFSPDRRAWRALVRIDDVDEDRHCFYATVPSWNVGIKVTIFNDDIPKGIQAVLAPDRRLHALVNTGADSSRDLFFYNWEAA